MGYLLAGPKSFSEYVGLKKPGEAKLKKLEEDFKSKLVRKLYCKPVSNELVSKDDLIKAALFRDLFFKKYDSLSAVKRRKFDVDSTVLFTLTTLTTEDVDVDLADVRSAMEKTNNFTLREQISKNMIGAVEKIKSKEPLSEKFLLGLHKSIMSGFFEKNPGQFRAKQVYIHKQSKNNPLGVEINYRPPSHQQVEKLVREFVEWYNESSLNPFEKAVQAHFKLYRIHPFSDGNKRICRLLLNKTLLNNGFPLLNVSEQKEKYFENLVESTEKNNIKQLTEFTLKEYFRQVKRFIKSNE